ncbi:large protein with C-terminal fibronectin type III domain [Bifidobacterium sp. DSM 109958]|uniref:Large protein with C-terminal fibronectin type III domain n=1 Tax=Bifidobacterium moraviense TaxID=2675323 RepID=A0A7Y0F1X5_9BIFI|nr:fibronectin type III domain-containing protein [Bifidobacterium sp. DSM 109958]NMN00522.1 large protein with C-terminal fibronectin type III domain [Bifidobacterium sp. DSM 109958]
MLVVLTLVLGLIVGAIVAETVVRRQVRLDNGTVWITSQVDRKAARLNVRAAQIEAGVDAPSHGFDVLQHDDVTLMTAGTRLGGIDAATLHMTDAPPIPDAATVALGGNVAAMLDDATGEVWTADASDPSALSAMAARRGAARMSLGAGGLIAVDHRGTAYGYRPADGMVLSLPSGAGPTEPAREIGSLSGGERLDAGFLTVVDGVPVIVAEGTAVWPSGSVRVDAGASPSPQLPPADDGQSGWVALAGEGTLAVVDLAGARIRTHATSGTGAPAVPVSVGGCVYAAWAQEANNFARLCDAGNAEDVAGNDAADRLPLSTLNGMTATAVPTFRVNHRIVVLNDVVTGAAWQPDAGGDAFDLAWDDARAERAEDDDTAERATDTRPEFGESCAQESGSIMAVDDEPDARAGAMRVLDVLRNDEQTDCSVLRIVRVGATSDPAVDVDVVGDGRFLQLDASGAGPGTVSFTYDVDDGRGRRSSATVALRLHDAATNAAPVWDGTPPAYDVEQSGTLTVNALDGAHDPEGDPLTLTDAAVRNTTQAAVSVRADGRLVVHAGSMAPGRMIIDVTASDGSANATGELHVSVHPAGTLPARIDPLSASAEPGETIAVRLGSAVHGSGASEPRLVDVRAPEGTEAAMDGSALAFDFRTATPGTHYVPYTVAQGGVESAGVARVDVAADAGGERRPVAVNDVALFDLALTATAEPLANDVDPSGGVLAVTSAQSTVDGVEVAVRDHRDVVVTARTMPSGPLMVTYTVANGVGTATGGIVVHPPSAPRSDVLVARDATASVRTGGVVSVDVLDHVLAPHGSVPRLIGGEPDDPAAFRGLTFVSGSAVRYQASDEAGTFPVTYTVEDGSGGTASGTISFVVHAADGDAKPAPEPRDVEARIVAGGTVRVEIPLTGIDADGDDVVLSGLGTTPPKLGRVVRSDATGLLYEAYRDSSGTDVFTYAVEDWTGQRAQGTVRVGVTATDAAATGVHALDDAVTMRPGAAASVDVTANDIAPYGAELTVDGAPEARGVSDVMTDGGTIRFTALAEGTAYVAYTVRDGVGMSDSAVLTVTVSDDAPPEPPTARDGRIAPEATIDKRSVTADVAPWISGSSGDAGRLVVAVHESAAAFARMEGGGATSTAVTVTLADRPLAVPYTVTDVASGLSATAFIHVPAYGVFPPTLRPRAPRLEVRSGETIVIPVADHVRVGAGKTAAIASPESVSATKSDGSAAYVDAYTLRFSAPARYAGPASITFTATDEVTAAEIPTDRIGTGGIGAGGIGTDAADADSGATSPDPSGSPRAPRIVNSAVLTLPITVIGEETAPPSFSSGVVDVAAGEPAQVISLAELTRTSGADANGADGTDGADGYVYGSEGLDGPVTAGVDRSGRLTVSARRDATPGTLVSVPFIIDYGAGTLTSGIMVRVVASTRPLARITPADVQARAGETVAIDIGLHAYNPFPDAPLAIVGASSANVSDDAAPHLEWANDGSTLTLTVPSSARVMTAVVTVTVADGTRDPARHVTGAFTVTVSDRPDAPLLSPVTETPTDGTVTLRFTPGAHNGSPVTEYRVDYEGGSRSCGLSTVCRIDGLANGRTYVFTVLALNAVGWSDPSNAVEVRPDRPPSAVGAVSATAGRESVHAAWDPPVYEGTPPDRYTATLRGSNGLTATVQTPGTSVDFAVPRASIADGVRFTVTVRAHNAAGDGEESAPSGPVAPWSAPDPPVVALTRQSGGRTVRVTVTPGDMRNAGCAAIMLAGAVEQRLDCPQSAAPDGGRHATADFTVGAGDLGRRLTVTATVIPSAAVGAVTASASLEPELAHEIGVPSDVRVSGADDRCTVRWTRRGRADSVEVQVDSLGARVVDATDGSATFTLAPWQRCGRATVRQGLDGAWGAAAEASGQYVYRTAAVIDADMRLRWDPSDPDVIRVEHGTTETFGQPVRQYVLSVNGVIVPWRPGTTAIALGANAVPAAPRYVWRLTVIGVDPALDAATGDEIVTGLRAAADPRSASEGPGRAHDAATLYMPAMRPPFTFVPNASPFVASSFAASSSAASPFAASGSLAGGKGGTP